MKNKNTRYLYMFIWPGIIGFLVFQLIPIIYAFVLSCYKYNGFTPPVFIGLDNYTRLFSDPGFWQALGNTTYMVVFQLPLNLMVALLLALLLNRKLKGIGVFRTIYYIPTLLPQVAAAIIIMTLLNNNYGMLNRVLTFLGFKPVNWLFDPKIVKFSIILVGLWSVGRGMVIYLANLQGISPSYYESADIDGANAIQKFFKITLPLITPSILYNLIIEATFIFQLFTPSAIITRGGPDGASTFYVYKLYIDGFRHSWLGYASAQAVVLFFIMIIFTMLSMKSSQSWVYYEGGSK